MKMTKKKALEIVSELEKCQRYLVIGGVTREGNISDAFFQAGGNGLKLKNDIVCHMEDNEHFAEVITQAARSFHLKREFAKDNG